MPNNNSARLSLKQKLEQLEHKLNANATSENIWEKTYAGIQKIMQEEGASNKSSSLQSIANSINTLVIKNNLFVSHPSVAYLQQIIFYGVQEILLKLTTTSSLKKLFNKNKEFRDFDTTELWQLIMEPLLSDEREEFNTHQQSVGMLNAFKEMLEKRNKTLTTQDFFDLYWNTQVRLLQKDKRPNSAEEMLGLLDIFDQERLSFTYTPPKSSQALEAKFFPALKMREQSTERALIIKTEANDPAYNATQEGFKELLAEAQKNNNLHFEIKNYQFDADGYVVADSRGKIADLVTKPTAAPKLRAYIKKIIKGYHKDIATTPKDKKLAVIARFCRDLALADAIENIGTPVIAIVLLNKLLLQNDFAPVILENAASIEANSVSELVAHIQKGQANFKRYATLSSHTLTTTVDESLDLIKPIDIEKSADANKESDSSKLKNQADDFREYRERYNLLEKQLLDTEQPEFLHGYDPLAYKKINIPGYRDKMSVEQMQALAVKEKLDLTSLGSLVRRIMLEQGRIVDMTDDFNRSKLGTLDLVEGLNEQVILPQYLYVKAIDRDHLGVCYGLIWAAAVILSQGGDAAIIKFADRVLAAAKFPHTRTALLTHGLIDTLQEQANELAKEKYVKAISSKAANHLVDTKPIRYTLDEVITQLKAEALTSQAVMYEFNTPRHAMMIGAMDSGGEKKFYFYDPNIGIGIYHTADLLYTGLKTYFSEKRLITYNALTRAGDESKDINAVTFEYQRIDTQALGEKKFPTKDGSYLMISDLFQEENVGKIWANRRNNLLVNEQLPQRQSVDKLNQHKPLKSLLASLDSQYIVKNYLLAAEKIYQANDLHHDSIPLLSEIKKEGEYYRVPFINPRQTEAEPNWINTSDDTLFKTKQYISEINGIDGMNAGFAIQQLIAWVQQGSRDAIVSPEMSQALATALSIHSVVGMAQIVHGSVHDITEVISIARTLWATSKQIEFAPASLLATTLSYSGYGMGNALSIFAVGLDAYEFAHADDEIQRAVFGTQLGFDSAGATLSLASLGASFMGATTVAGVLAPLGIIAAGLSVGAAALARVYGEVAEDAAAIGRYFEKIDHAYKQCYEYDADQQSLSFLVGNVIKAIDFDSGVITYGSQYLYASDYGFLTFNDVPGDNGDRSKAITVRSALEYDEIFTITNTQEKNADIVILPSTPLSYISHYSTLELGIGSSQGAGYDALRRIQKNSAGLFICERKAFPMIRRLRDMSQQHIATTVAINLDKRNRLLCVPKLLQETYNNHKKSVPFPNSMTYQLNGQGGQYMLALNKGATLMLETKEGTASHWLIDNRYLDSDEINILDKQLIVAGVPIYVPDIRANTISIIKKNGDTYIVDFVKQTLLLSIKNVDQWNTAHTETIAAYFERLNQQQQLAGPYTLINNYLHNQINIGRAYYDSKNNRIWFSTFSEVDAVVLDELINAINSITASSLVTGLKKTSQFLFNNDREYQSTNRCTWTKTIHLNQPSLWQKLLTTLQNHPKLVPAELSDLVKVITQLFAINGKQIDSYSNFPTTYKKKVLTQTNTQEFILDLDLATQKTAGISMPITQLKEQLLILKTALSIRKESMLLGKEAELIGVINQDPYFYHAQQQILWCVEGTTGSIKTQFINPIDSREKRFWQEGNTIYMACATSVSNIGKSELIYRIEASKMDLVKIRVADTTHDKNDLLDLFRINPNINVHDWLSTTPQKKLVLSDSSHLITASYLPFTAITGKGKDGIEQYYWLHLPTGKILRPKLSGDVLADLVLAAYMPTPLAQNIQQDIFYFYNAKQKMLYRQIGYGTEASSADLQKTAEPIVIPQLLDILHTDDGLFIATEEGLVKQVDADGHLNLAAVNKHWLTKHKDNWCQSLAAINNKKQALLITGITSVDKKVGLSVWCQNNKIIISTIQSNKLQFLNLDKSGEYARLFDAATKKLYHQPIIDNAAFIAMLDENLNVHTPSDIPPALDLFPGQNFQSAKLIHHKLRLITQEGVILSLDQQVPGKAHLIGVNQNWQQRYSGTTLADAITQLAAIWAHGEAVVLQGNAIPTWYHLSTKQIIKAPELKHTDKPVLIGIDADHQAAYIYSATKGLYQAHCGTVEETIAATWLGHTHLQRFDNAALIQGTDDSDVLQVLPIDKVDAFIMSGGKKRDIYQIDTEDRQHYGMLAIDNFDQEQTIDDLQLSVGNLAELFISRHQDDLLLTDRQGVVQIKKVFSKAQADYTHMQIILSDDHYRFEKSLTYIMSMVESSKDQLIQSIAIFDQAEISTQMMRLDQRQVSFFPYS